MKRFAVLCHRWSCILLPWCQKAVNGPGKYEGWGPDIDSIAIARPFKTADYALVVVAAAGIMSPPLRSLRGGHGDIREGVPAGNGLMPEGLKKGVPELRRCEGRTGRFPVLIVRGQGHDAEPVHRGPKADVGWIWIGGLSAPRSSG